MATYDPTKTLLYVKDRLLGRNFLVDTGVEVSVFPATVQQQHSNQPAEILAAANGSHISTYGRQKFALKFGERLFQRTFLKAQVSQPLLGADFLRSHNLMPDLTNRNI